MTQFSKVNNKTKFSEFQVWSVDKVVGNEVQLKSETGDTVVVDKGYVEKYLISSDQYGDTKNVTQTEIINIFVTNPNTVFTVNFQKQVKAADVEKEILDAYENSTPKELATKVKKAVKKALEGEERVLVGKHSGNVNSFGRVDVIDLEIASGHNVRQVDPRTISQLIIKGVKYIVK